MKKYLIFLGALICAFLLGASTTPPKEVIKTETKVEYMDKETITVKVKRPDGTVETTKKTVDKSIVKQDSEQKSKPVAKDWHVNVGVKTDITRIQPAYTLQVERRVFGNMFVGANIDTMKTVGVTVGVEF